MRVLNLYAGIGGNRKLWENVEVTAVEFNPDIAAVYRKHFPGDTVIVGDAHAFLLENYKNFDFIWSSRPCQTHSRARMWASKGGKYAAKYPDLDLYQEIVFLEHFFDGNWVVENVIPYYEPLISPTVKIGRHFIWSNMVIPTMYNSAKAVNVFDVLATTVNYGFDISKEKMNCRKVQVIRNMVSPEIGQHLISQAKQNLLF